MSKTPQVVAAVAAAIAEEIGTEVSAIRIVTFREISTRKTGYISKKGYNKYQLEDELV